MLITQQEHSWKSGQTNEYCEHCGLIFESDLGWTSADGVKCVQRTFEIKNESDIPKKIASYAAWHGLIWIKEEKIFIKPYSTDSYTLTQLKVIIDEMSPNK